MSISCLQLVQVAKKSVNAGFALLVKSVQLQVYGALEQPNKHVMTGMFKYICYQQVVHTGFECKTT